MKTLLSLLMAATISLSGCAGLTDWMKSPGGQQVINSFLIDALKIVGTLLLAGEPKGADLRAQAIGQLRAKHPELTSREASVYVDEAIQIKNGK